MVTGTRDGYLWAWRAGTSDDRTANMQWEGFRHDNADTGNLGTPLTQGVRGVGDAGRIVCPNPDDGRFERLHGRERGDRRAHHGRRALLGRGRGRRRARAARGPRRRRVRLPRRDP